MTQQRLLEELRLADPAPVDAERPEATWSSAVVLQTIHQRSGTMQKIERKTEPPPSRRRGLLVAAAALVVAIIAAGVVIGLIGGSSDEPDVGSLTPGPISSFEDIGGTYQRQGPGGLIWFQFFEDGTFHSSQNRDLVEDRPQAVWQTRFEGTEILITTTSSFCPQPDQGGTYQIHLLENGNLQFVGVGEDGCGARTGSFSAEWAPVP
ncbi:MAG: hypothetical protein V3V82_03200 [Acidimicrobiia bacterium]